MIRLDKILANMGYGTRKEVKQMLKGGRVAVSGCDKITPETKIDPETAVVTVDGEIVKYTEFIYLMLNKPQGYVSATYDNFQPIVTELVPNEYMHYDAFPVGRLDIDTEGLLILTNDGQFAHNLLSPKKHVPKQYFAKVKNEIRQSDIDAFAGGVTLDDGYVALPAKLEVTEDGCLVTIYEGKFHQVKRMFESVDNKVTYLKRVKMGNLSLDESLELGEIRELTKEELDLLWI